MLKDKCMECLFYPTMKINIISHLHLWLAVVLTPQAMNSIFTPRTICLILRIVILASEYYTTQFN